MVMVHGVSWFDVKPVKEIIANSHVNGSKMKNNLTEYCRQNKPLRRVMGILWMEK
jgi:hypothetical protein